jgi:predicted nucleotidyltransferase
MHDVGSDIDLSIYGADNFRRVEETVEKLVSEGALSYVFSTRLDCSRKLKGRYKSTMFMFGSIRKSEEIAHSYGEYRYHPVRHVIFRCRVTDDSEAMFRPTVYRITDYQPLNHTSKLADEECPSSVVSMIGCYRNMARKEENIRVSGLLERVEEVRTRETQYQVVVGTGIYGNEYIRPVPS